MGGRDGTRRRSAARRAGTVVGLAGLVHAAPSALVLGQWTAAGSLPGGWCRWRAPSGTDARAVALTFDDGPSPEGTPEVLDALDGLGLRATFFLLGANVAAHPALVGEILGRGHAVGLHGHRHDRHLARDPVRSAADLRTGLAALRDAGADPRWYRPSYGQLTAATAVTARRLGLEVVLWSAWGREWAERSPEPVVARIGRRLQPGAIVLLHDTETSCRPGTAALVRQVLAPLAGLLGERDLVARTLDELAGVPGRVPAGGEP